MSKLTYKSFYIAVYNGIITETDLKKELKLAQEQLRLAGIHVNISSPIWIRTVNPLNPSQVKEWWLKGIFLKNEADMNYFLLMNNKFHRWTEEKFWENVNNKKF
jgi:hypothetical protein